LKSNICIVKSLITKKQTIMQLHKFLTAVLLSVLFCSSCGKKNDDIIKPGVPVEGIWRGKHSYLSGPLNNDYVFNIKAGGVLERFNANGQKLGEGTGITGTYTLTGGGTYSVIASFDKVAGKLDGTWGNGLNNYDGGYWYMNKVQ
jgi:hypothetical protein